MLKFFDGFDGYDTASDPVNYGGYYGNFNLVFSNTVRIGTGKSLELGSDVGYINYRFDEDQDGKTIYAGFAMRKTNNYIYDIFQLRSSANGLQCELYLTAGNILQARRGSTVVLAESTTVIADNIWYWIDLEILVHGSTGIFNLYINEVEEFTFTGNTQAQADATVRHFELQGPQHNSGSMLIDDLYVCNSDGTLNNGRLGEVQAKFLPLESDNSIQWTRNTGSTNVSAVDEPIGAPDNTTTYIQSAVSGNRDLYNLSTIADLGDVYGVKTVTIANKDDAGAKSIKTGVKSGATEQLVTHALSTSFLSFVDVFETSDGVDTPFNSTTIDSLLSVIEDV